MTDTLTRPRRLLLTKEVAALLECSPKRVRELAADGLLVPVRLTPLGHLRFRREDVERLVAGEKVP
jgi:DNA-binding transcriptional MerR regulator